MDELWNAPLTRENIVDFYQSTIPMVYGSVQAVTKESTRAEKAIIKSYLDIFQQRTVVKGEDVIFVFGDLLLKNANEIVETNPPPANMNFPVRNLDEYTRNFMLEKIIAKIDSTGYKFSEFISSDSKKNKSNNSFQRVMDLFPVTPLLVFQLIVLALIIWGVSYVAITIPYRNSELVNTNIYEVVPLQDEYVGILPYYPLYVNFPVTEVELPEGEEVVETAPAESNVLAPVIVPPTEPEPSATRG